MIQFFSESKYAQEECSSRHFIRFFELLLSILESSFRRHSRLFLDDDLSKNVWMLSFRDIDAQIPVNCEQILQLGLGFISQDDHSQVLTNILHQIESSDVHQVFLALYKSRSMTTLHSIHKSIP